MRQVQPGEWVGWERVQRQRLRKRSGWQHGRAVLQVERDFKDAARQQILYDHGEDCGHHCVLPPLPQFMTVALSTLSRSNADVRTLIIPKNTCKCSIYSMPALAPTLALARHAHHPGLDSLKTYQPTSSPAQPPPLSCSSIGCPPPSKASAAASSSTRHSQSDPSSRSLCHSHRPQ